jgi:nickel-type superoxide dismutase maturation protease
VVNGSMLPLLSPGEEVLAAPRTDPEPGEVWVLAHPQKPGLKIIKTVVGKDVHGHYDVRGLNQTCSEDSRQFGPAGSELFLGRVESLFFSREPGSR